MPTGGNSLPFASRGRQPSIYTGPLGPRSRISYGGACAKKRPYRPFSGPTRIPKRSANTAIPQSENEFDYSQQQEGSAQPQGHPQPAASRRQQAKEQQDLLWKERQPEHRFRRYCFLAHEQQRRQDFAADVQADFASRLGKLHPYCQKCESAEHFEAVLPAAPIVFAGITGYVTVGSPEYRCRCGYHVVVHPISVGCFPATPSRPEVWYDNQLLALTAAAQHAGPMAIQAHCSALKQLYMFNGFDSGRPALWDNLGMAAQQWKRVEVEIANRHGCDLSPILPEQPKAWQSCPCCWQTCQAAIGDACLGITHLRSAARNMHNIQPFHEGGPFIPDEEVQQFLENQRSLAPDLWQPVSCVDFKAIGTLGRRAGVLDILGMAALVCRHEFTMIAANLFTEENFAYYDLMLSQVLQQYTEGDGRRLVCFFLDIACQFKPYWDRLHPEAEDVHMAIGPWHARVHKAICQRQFGARQTPESGLTFGDNIEHLWAPLRKQAHLLKYMSKARRQDHLTTLMWHLEHAKQQKLASTLRRWYDVAKLKQRQNTAHLEALEQQSADMAGSQEALSLEESPGMHAPLDKLQWQHEYQRCLEKVILLSGLLSVDAQTPQVIGMPSSLLEHEYRKDLTAASAAAAKYERKHNLTESWTSQDLQYQKVAVERKCFWVHHFQNAIAADVDKVHVLQLAAQRTSRQNRSTSSSFKKQVRSAHKRIDKSISQLQQWHAVSGDIGAVPYDPALLSADAMLQHGWVVPWLTPYQSGSALQLRIADVQQQVQRCIEEQDIIKRETADAVLFYQHQEEAVQAAIQKRALAAVDAAEDVLPQQDFSSLCAEFRPEVVQEHYVAGQLHVLYEYQQRCQQLLLEMESLSSYVATPVTNASNVADDASLPESGMQESAAVNQFAEPSDSEAYDMYDDEDVSSSDAEQDMFQGIDMDI